MDQGSFIFGKCGTARKTLIICEIAVIVKTGGGVATVQESSVMCDDESKNEFQSQAFAAGEDVGWNEIHYNDGTVRHLCVT